MTDKLEFGKCFLFKVEWVTLPEDGCSRHNHEPRSDEKQPE